MNTSGKPAGRVPRKHVLGYGMGMFSSVSTFAGLEYAEWKTGLRAEGLVNSLYLMANKAGYAIGGAVLGLGLAFFEYQPNQPTYSEETLTGFLFMLFGVSAVCRGLLSVLMLFHNFSDSRFLSILEELKIRKVSENVVT